MRTQNEIDSLKRCIENKIATYENEVRKLKTQIDELKQEERELYDPHALIPNSCRMFKDWIKGHPFPKSCLNMIFRNRHTAEINSYVCNTYQTDYHIVKIQDDEAEYLECSPMYKQEFQHESH